MTKIDNYLQKLTKVTKSGGKLKNDKNDKNCKLDKNQKLDKN